MPVRLALAVIAGATSAAALYAALRAFQAVWMPDPNPALVIWSEHAGYFWRAWTVAYAGGMVGFVTWAVAKKEPARVARVLARFVVIAAAMLAVQALLFP
jgi:hypothetical protein